MGGRPDFIIAGVPKAGTTTLWRWFQQHRSVFVPSSLKEPSFFAYEGTSQYPAAGPFDRGYYDLMVTEWDAYQRIYAVPEAQNLICGDPSPLYALSPEAPERIARRLPDAKVVLVLRNPVERAFSQFAHHVRDGLETTHDFRRALGEEPRRIEAGWSPSHIYRHGSRYRDIVPRFAAAIPPDRLRFVLFDDLASRPEQTFAELCRFIGVPDEETPDTTLRANAASASTKRTRSAAMRQVLRRKTPLLGGALHIIPKPLRQRLKRAFNDLNQGRRVTLDAKLAGELVAEFEPDIRCVEQLLDRSLADWRRSRGQDAAQ